jgi:predicted O-methyltransferase YrrM/DNA-binding PadR family transcriptional regulator
VDESEGRGRSGGRDRGDGGRGRDRDIQGRDDRDDRDSRGRSRDREGRGRDGHDGRGRDGRGGRASGRRGGRGGRGGQRGDVRAAIMSLLGERPMHGYEMLGELDDRTGGLWRPSPGSLYPALQLLEDQGLVRSVNADGRRRYELTEAGQAEQAAAPVTPAPWEAIVGAADQGDVALSGILRQVAVAADQVAEVGSAAQKASAETMLAGLRRQLYLLLADSPAAERSPAAGDTAPMADKNREAPETWNRVEDYFDGALLPHDSVLEQALQSSQQAGLPGINVSPSQGKLLHLLARGIGASRILEIGTLGGYSTIWLARALPASGRLISLELDAHHAEVARANVTASGLADLVDIRTGPALASLEALGAADEEPFDLVFIDADKESNPDYFSWAMRLTHPGSLVVVDNVVRRGRVADDDNSAPDIVGVRRMITAMAADDRIDATTIQTVGSKGYDGLTIGLVTEPTRQPADER